MPPSNVKDAELAKAAEMESDGEMNAVEERLQKLLKEGAKIPADADVDDDLELPDYYDPDKFRLGQRAFFNNVFTMMIAKLSGLLTLLAVPSILEILMFTKQSGTPCTAFRRYVSTILHTFVWYEKTPGKQLEFLKSLKNVRKKHCIVSRRSSEAGLGRISQLDMALTQFGFIGFTLISGDTLGVHMSDEELHGLVHFWRVIGHMLGMDERYNLCNGTVSECRALCRRLLDDVFLPCFALKNKNFDEMGRILLEGLWPVNPHLDAKAYTAFTLHLAVSAATNNNHSVVIDTSDMSLYSKFLLNLQLSVHRYLLPTRYWWSRFFRAFFNMETRLAIFLTENFPFLAYWRFGRNKSHVNIYKFHYD
ncbi:hypothetical protein TSAR_007864 [Trichomalopsis sarcophagae]|uniref:ER-bound oxygenase mpaB/mpaB'/Rubber oxygenase catalytic domain-containing protein n=1 Tax=Trichomalopsis sarcophagae TaxID=543379 RepID=A0A232FGT8_9HYME|nr:hypothetical protein TSAR_007864 [Trichomalopsis sarcophagae]